MGSVWVRLLISLSFLLGKTTKINVAIQTEVHQKINNMYILIHTHTHTHTLMVCIMVYV